MNDKVEARARRYDIMAEVAQTGGLTLEQILKQFGAGLSRQTILTDVRQIAAMPKFLRNARSQGLQAEDLFRKTYFGDNLNTEDDRKAKLANALVSAHPPLVNVGNDSVVIGPGTTTLEVLHKLAVEYPGVQILTCNFGVVLYPDIMMSDWVNLSGGWLRKSCGCLVGAAAVRGILAFSANTAIIGVSGLAFDDRCQDVALYHHDEVQGPVNDALVKKRKKIIVVTTAEKIGNVDAWEFAQVGKLEADLYILTDATRDKVQKEIEDIEDLSEQVKGVEGMHLYLKRRA